MLPALRLGGILLIFGLGWYSKGVLVENKELKRLKAQLEASNTALVEYQNRVRFDTEELERIKEELDNEGLPSCDDPISICLSRGFERLHSTR